MRWVRVRGEVNEREKRLTRTTTRCEVGRGAELWSAAGHSRGRSKGQVGRLAGLGYVDSLREALCGSLASCSSEKLVYSQMTSEKVLSPVNSNCTIIRRECIKMLALQNYLHDEALA